jgi:hypothetical protein
VFGFVIELRRGSRYFTGAEARRSSVIGSGFVGQRGFSYVFCGSEPAGKGTLMLLGFDSK